MNGSHPRSRWPVVLSINVWWAAGWASALLAQQPVASSKTSPALAFKNVTVIDVTDGRLRPGQTVVVTGNRVQAVGPSGAVVVPPGARLVDAQGKYLVPGFWDMHPHIEDIGNSDRARQDSLYRATYPRFIAHGITGVREMAQRFPYGADSFRVWQRQVMDGKRIGPRGIGPSADLTYNSANTLFGMDLETPDDAVFIIDSLKAAGDAFVKFHDDNMEPKLFFALAREARRVGIPLVGHVPRSVSNIEAADSGMRSIEHVPTHHSCVHWPEPIDTTDPDTRQRCGDMVAAYLRNNLWMVPTLVRLHYIRRNVLLGQQFVRLVHSLGMRNFMVGTDYSFTDDNVIPKLRARMPTFRAGLSALDEIVTLAAAGLGPLEALRAATLNPAKFINATDSLGTVAPGKLADLVLLDANPLADIHNVMKIRAVVANGRYFDRAALDALDPDGVEVKRAREYLGRELALPQPKAPVQKALALQGVTVVDVANGRRITRQTVVVVGNRVQALGPAGTVQIPSGARMIDARDKYLIPGLWDMHTHVDDPDYYRYVARQDSIHRALYPRFLAHGVTGLREMGQRFRDGADSFRVWQRDVVAGRRVGPRVVGPSADVTYGREYKELYYGIHIDTATVSGPILDSLKAAGDAFVVINDTAMKPAAYFALAREARRVGLPLVGPVPAGLAARDIADSGQHSLDYVQANHSCWPNWPRSLDTAAALIQCAEVAKAYIRDSTWLVPLLARARYIDRNLADAQRFVGILRREGVTTFLAGTDVGVQFMQDERKFRPGLSAAEEVVLLAGAGLTPLEALQAATLNPAKFFHATDSLGTVAPGKVADMVVLDGDPLVDIRNVLKPSAVIANGRFFDRAMLRSMDPDGTGSAGGVGAGGPRSGRVGR